MGYRSFAEGGGIAVVAGADEGVVVVVPVAAIFLIGCAALFGAGSLLLLYFFEHPLNALNIDLVGLRQFGLEYLPA